MPVRYYHRPFGRDDAHGYGKASRFLTPAVRETCEIVTLDEPMALPTSAAPAPRTITVSVDALFG